RRCGRDRIPPLPEPLPQLPALFRIRLPQRVQLLVRRNVAEERQHLLEVRHHPLVRDGDDQRRPGRELLTAHFTRHLHPQPPQRQRGRRDLHRRIPQLGVPLLQLHPRLPDLLVPLIHDPARDRIPGLHVVRLQVQQGRAHAVRHRPPRVRDHVRKLRRVHATLHPVYRQRVRDLPPTPTVRRHRQLPIRPVPPRAVRVPADDLDLVLTRRERHQVLEHHALLRATGLREARDPYHLPPLHPLHRLAVLLERQRDRVLALEALAVPLETQRAVRQRQPEQHQRGIRRPGKGRETRDHRELPRTG